MHVKIIPYFDKNNFITTGGSFFLKI